MLPNGLQPGMGARVSTSQRSSSFERKLQKALRTMELRLNSLNDRSFFRGTYNTFYLVGHNDMEHIDKFCDIHVHKRENDRDIFFVQLDWNSNCSQSTRDEMFAHVYFRPGTSPNN